MKERNMNGEDNKNILRAFFKAFAAENLEMIDRLTSNDFTFWAAPTTIGSGTYTKEAFLKLISDTFDNLAGQMTLQLGDFTEEDDRVSVTMVGNMPLKNGKVYNNHYHFLFFVRDGKISKMKEYSDTFHVGEIFGFPGAADENKSSLQSFARQA
jgi:uncharacterized protein